MFGFLTSFRAALLLGKAHRQLDHGRYRDALERALKAQKLRLPEQFEWLSYSIEGKARYQLGDSQNALPALQKAEVLLRPIAEARADSKHLQNIIGDIRTHIERIERSGGGAE